MKTKKYILIIALSLISISNFAQTFTEQTGINLTGVREGSTAWGDYNNDGYLDILLTGELLVGGGVSKIYKNNGNGTFTEQTGITLAGVSESSVAWGDYNNDGYLDILLTGFQTINGFGSVSKIYKNNGNGTFAEQTGINLTAVRNGSVAWGDYNNDGYLDILLTGSDGPNRVSKIYKNNGNETFTEQTGFNLTDVEYGSVAWGDYNIDGYLDILLTGYDGLNRVSKIYKNNGNGIFTEQTGISLTGVQGGSVAWGDYNNDGYLDILLTGYNSLTVPNVNKIYKNNGNGTFTEQTGIILIGGNSVAWGDYNNDGYLDILFTGFDGNYASKIYKNNGNGTFTEQTGISLTGVGQSSVAWGDYNNDGYLDILLTGENSGSSMSFVSKIYKNNNTINNNSPSIPTNLIYNSISNKFSWNKSIDDHTPSSALTYNLAIGDLNNPNEIKSAQSDINTGFRRIVEMGNQQLDTFCIINLNFDSTYYARVQAIDNAFKGSAFTSPLQIIAPPNGNIINNDTTIMCGGSVQLDITVVNGNPSNLSYLWTPTIGLLNANIRNPIANPLQTTWYKVTVTSQYSLLFTDSIQITVNPMTVNAGTDITIFQGDSVTLNPTTNYSGLPTNLTWLWSPATGLNSTNIKSPKAKPTTTTNYKVNLTSIEGCIAKDTIKISVLTAGQSIVFLKGSVNSCKGDTITLESLYNGIPQPLLWTSVLPGGILYDNNTVIGLGSTITFILQSPLIIHYRYPGGISGLWFGGILIGGNPYLSVVGYTTASYISGATTVCQGQDSLVYKVVPNIGQASSYFWTLPDSTIVTTTYDSLIINYASSFTSGNLTVKGYNSTCGFGDSITITITKTPLTVNAGSDVIKTCGDSVIFNPNTNYSGLPSKLSWSWSPSTSLDNSLIKSPKAKPISTTNYIVNLTSVDGCIAADTIKFTVNPMFVNAGIDVIKVCGDSITFNPTTTYGGKASNLSWFWTPATGLNSNIIKTPIAKPLFSTNYVVNLTSSEGCIANDTIKVTVNKANFNLAFNVNQTLFTAPPFAAQFTNSTANASNYDFIWDFGDGTTLASNNPSVFHQFGFNGLYSVTLIARHKINLCTDTLLKTDYIFCTGGVSCNYTANIAQIGPITKCQGDSVLLSCNTDTSYTYQWRINGTPITNGGTNSQIYVHQSGAYSVTIYKLSMGCAITSSSVQVNFINLAKPQILTNGNVNPCTSDSIKLYTALSYNTYLWSTGATTPYIYVTQTGIYSLTVKDINNCTATSLPDTIITTYLAPQSLCLVGVDTATNKNIIVWNKPVSSVISAYKIYKESTAANIYNSIGTQPYSSISKFIDQNSNPSTKADRYKISAIDTCGSETLISQFHKTNHLTINQGVGTNWNLIWDGYEGFTFPTYKIYRGTSTANMALIGSIQSNLTSYTDNPGIGVFYYMIEVVNPNNCNPSKSMNSSFSNIIQTSNVSVNEHSKDDLNFKVYPNPFKNELIVEMTDNKQKLDFEIINSIGQPIFKGKIKDKTVIQTANFVPGVYLIKIKNGKNYLLKKIIKE